MKQKLQSGRSMVEMLGVLAIIGVLSVGGIAGYNTAVTKIRLNKFQNFLNFVSLALQDIYAKEKDSEFIAGSVEEESYRNNQQVILNTGLIPDDYQKQLDFITTSLKMKIFVDPNTGVSWYNVKPRDFSLKGDYLEGCRNLLSLKYPEKVLITQVGTNVVWWASTDSPANREKFCQAAAAAYQSSPAWYFYMWIHNLENLK